MTLREYGRLAYGFVAIPFACPSLTAVRLFPFGIGHAALFWAAL